MATDIIEESPAVYPAAVVRPEGGDPRTAASVATSPSTGMTGLANRTKYLKEHVDALDTEFANVRIFTFPSQVDPTATQWEWFDDATNGGAFKQSNTNPADLSFYNQIPGLNDRMLITSVAVILKGSAEASHTNLPATMPLFNFRVSPGLSETPTSLSGNQTDSSASVAAYDQWHQIFHNLATPYSVAARDFFHFQVFGEAGANSIGDVLVRGFLVYAYIEAFAP